MGDDVSSNQRPLIEVTSETSAVIGRPQWKRFKPWKLRNTGQSGLRSLRNEASTGTMPYPCPRCGKPFVSRNGRNRHCITTLYCRSVGGVSSWNIPPEQIDEARSKIRAQRSRHSSRRPKSASKDCATTLSPSCLDNRTSPSSRGLSGQSSLAGPRRCTVDIAAETSSISTEKLDTFISGCPPGTALSSGAGGVIASETKMDWDGLLREALPQVSDVAVGGESWTSMIDAATWTGPNKAVSVSCEASTSNRDAATSAGRVTSADVAKSTRLLKVKIHDQSRKADHPQRGGGTKRLTGICCGDLNRTTRIQASRNTNNCSGFRWLCRQPPPGGWRSYD